MGFKRFIVDKVAPFQTSTFGPYRYKLNWSWVEVREVINTQGLTPTFKRWKFESCPI